MEEQRYRVVMEIAGDGAEAGEEEPVGCKPDSRKNNETVVISSEYMGEGDPRLGRALMKSYLYALTCQEELPDAVIFYNGGVKLTCGEGSSSGRSALFRGPGGGTVILRYLFELLWPDREAEGGKCDEYVCDCREDGKGYPSDQTVRRGEMDLEELADLCIRNYKMISLVGAGGKSTLMYALAEKISRRGRKVLVSTTTHIYEPKENFAREEPEIRSLWRAGRYAVVGERTEGGKLRSLPVPRLREYGKRADLILLEADGSRRKPMKVPAEREPVILPECDLVLGVIGLSCLGKPLREVCFRPELACTLFGAELEEIVGEKLAASVLTSEREQKKRWEQGIM